MKSTSRAVYLKCILLVIVELWNWVGAIYQLLISKRCVYRWIVYFFSKYFCTGNCAELNYLNKCIKHLVWIYLIFVFKVYWRTTSVASAVANVSEIHPPLSGRGHSQWERRRSRSFTRHCVQTDETPGVSCLTPNICGDDDGASDWCHYLPPHLPQITEWHLVLQSLL